MIEQKIIKWLNWKKFEVKIKLGDLALKWQWPLYDYITFPPQQKYTTKYV